MNKITLSFFVLFMVLGAVPTATARDLVVAVSPILLTR